MEKLLQQEDEGSLKANLHKVWVTPFASLFTQQKLQKTKDLATLICWHNFSRHCNLHQSDLFFKETPKIDDFPSKATSI